MSMLINTADVKRSGDTMTGALLLPDGLPSTPALSFSGDTDTGVYRIGANDMALVASGSSGSTELRLRTATSAASITRDSTTIANLLNITSTGLTSSSGTQVGLLISPTINQSSTAGYAALHINTTETATGSGTKTLILAQVGGTSRMSLTNTGTLNVTNTSGDSITLNGTGTANTFIRLQDDGTDTGSIFSTNGSTNMTVRAQADLVLTSTNAGTSRTLTLGSSALTFGDTINIAVSGTTGTKIGTATSQKLGVWNATPIVQPTTAVAAATFVANTSGILNDTATFDGYTLGQVVKALRNIGLLA